MERRVFGLFTNLVSMPTLQPDLSGALFMKRSGIKNLSADRQSGNERRNCLPK